MKVRPHTFRARWLPEGIYGKGGTRVEDYPRFELVVDVDAAGRVTHNGVKFFEAGTPLTKAPPKKKRGSCGKAKLYQWLGMRWYGRPWPLRWEFNLGTPDFLLWRYVPDKGCGCMKWAKDLTNKWKRKVRAVRYA